MVENFPLVSCLCVTRSKPRKLKRAVECFLEQRYLAKELVILYESDDSETEAVVEELVPTLQGCVLPVKVSSDPKMTLGELRNIAVDNARGEFICQWDDDDWYHNERISRQLQAVISSERQACLLTNWLMFDEVKRQAYFSQFRLWEGSLLCRKDVLATDLKYPPAARREDTLLTRLLVARGYVFPLVDAGLYIYTVHENNTWPREHFESLFARSQKLSGDVSRLIGEILAGNFSIEAASEMLRDRRLLRQLNYFPDLARSR